MHMKAGAAQHVSRFAVGIIQRQGALVVESFERPHEQRPRDVLSGIRSDCQPEVIRVCLSRLPGKATAQPPFLHGGPLAYDDFVHEAV